GVLFGGEPGLEYGHGIPKDEEEKIHGAMRELVEQRLGDLAKVKTALVVSESPAKGIVDYAEKEGVDLIVISTHGRTGLRRMMIGSVAERVVRHAHCPVLTLRSKLQD
ncbi:MAG TPA: universal stress protein, partial [Polyangiaceae bacterium LLY-WYZ-15_(1-7)]|nr:universal stress protein [Polyangiaceae bacterium LLY-WYZ-15_(1-7)]